MEYTLENEAGEEIDFEVDYDYTPGEPMMRYTRNGDGYPGSAPYCELNNQKDIEEILGRELTSIEVECIEEAALDRHNEMLAEGPDPDAGRD